MPESSASHRGRPITQRVLDDLHRACWSGSVVAQVTWPHRREPQPNPLNIHELIAQRPYHIPPCFLRFGHQICPNPSKPGWYEWFPIIDFPVVGALPQPANPWLHSLVSHKDILHWRWALPWSEPYLNSSFHGFTQPNFLSFSQLRRALPWSEPYPNSSVSAFPQILILRDPHILGPGPSDTNTYSFPLLLYKNWGKNKYTHMQHFHFTPTDSYQAKTKHYFIQHTQNSVKHLN